MFTVNNSIIFNIFSNGQMKIDYIIGLRPGDIGDYAQPTEKIYSEVFNKTGLESLVHIRYIPRSRNENVTLSNDQISLFPFDYQPGGPFYGVKYSIKIIEIFFFSFFICSLIGGLFY
jgi:hypothetical protein